MTDRRIDPLTVERCRQGDREAFRDLFEATKDRVYSIALHFFRGDGSVAADITQQIYVDLFSRIGQFRGESEFTTWLYRVAVNACADEHRRRRRLVFFGGADEADRRFGSGATTSRTGEGGAGSGTGAELEGEETAVAVRHAVSRLTPKLRAAILLKHFEELSYDEMARVLGCTKGTVASRLNRAHAILGRRLARLRGESAEGE